MTGSQAHACLRIGASVVVRSCEEPSVLDMDLPERLLSLGGRGGGVGGGTQALLQCGRELPTRTADRGLFYSVLVCCCACTYVSFQSSPSFLFSLGWGLKTGGGSYSHKDRR